MTHTESPVYKLVNLLVRKLKGEKYTIDYSIPISYMVSFFAKRILSLCYGLLLLRRSCLVFIHPTSIVKCHSKFRFAKNLNIDRGCFIDALSTQGIRLGENVSIGKNTTIECTGTLQNIGVGLIVGDRVGLGTHGFFGCAGGVEIGDDTIFGNYVSIHSENHNFSLPDVPIRLQGITRKGIVVGKNCWIGAKTTILDGAIIGDGCVVAAGSVVRSGMIPDNSIIGGIPAKILKKRIL